MTLVLDLFAKRIRNIAPDEIRGLRYAHTNKAPKAQRKLVLRKIQKTSCGPPARIDPAAFNPRISLTLIRGYIPYSLREKIQNQSRT